MTHWFRRSRDVRRQRSKYSPQRLLRAEPLEPRLTLNAGAAWEQAVSPPLAVDATAAASATVTLRPVADAGVRGTAPITNFGKAGIMRVAAQSSSQTSNDAESYLKFNLSSINAPITKAVLRLMPRSVGKSVSSLTVGVQLLEDVDDGWVEGRGGTNAELTGPITWFNSPYSIGRQLQVAGSRLKAWTPVSIDVTSLIKQSFNANGIASFELKPISRLGANRWVDFVSRESTNAAYQPVLVITKGVAVGQPPKVVQQPTALNLTDTSVELAALGASTGGEQKLAYSWSVVSPAGAVAPTFSDNGTNAAKNTTVTFHQAGTYAFTTRITDLNRGLWVSSNSVTVTVKQSFAGFRVTPSAVSLGLGATLQFSAQGLDQFGRAIAGSVADVTWSVDGGGTIDHGTGLYTAPPAPSLDTVTAQTGSYSATAAVTVGANLLGLNDPTLGNLVDTLDADGSISREDMLTIFRSDAATTDGVVSSADLADLNTILGDAARLNIPGYVQVLSGDVINGNTANAYYQGTTLGNLAVGSTASQLNRLVSKWFLGADHPDTGGYGYSTVSGSLFTSAGPSHLDEHQGNVGDCYLISTLGSIADSSQAAVRNMFIDNGVDAVTGAHTWTVRFYANGVADYVTVDDMLPAEGWGSLVFQGAGSTTSDPEGLWLALAEKAYAQWNETGKEGRDGSNSYSSLEGGWMDDVSAQVLGHSAPSYSLNTSSDQKALIAGVANKKAVTIGTFASGRADGSLSFGLYGSHAYSVIGYNSTAKTFTLYNPWGTSQPFRALTWAELRTVSDGFVVADASGTQPIAGIVLSSSVRPVIAPRPIAQPMAAINPAAPIRDDSHSQDELRDASRLAARAVDAAMVQPAPSECVDWLDSATELPSMGVNAHRPTLARSNRPSPISKDFVTLVVDDFFQTV